MVKKLITTMVRNVYSYNYKGFICIVTTIRVWNVYNVYNYN